MLHRQMNFFLLFTRVDSLAAHRPQLSLMFEVEALGFLVDILIVGAEAIVVLIRPLLLPSLLQVKSGDFVLLIAIVAALPLDDIDGGKEYSENDHSR